MDVISYSEAQAQLETLMARVVVDHAPLVIVPQNSEAVVMVSLSDWSAMEETLHLHSSEANANRLLAAIGQLDATPGNITDFLER